MYVHKYSSVDIVYGELGVFPLEVCIKSSMMNYWSRLITGKNTKSSYIMYSYLLHLHTSGVYISSWLENIRNICIECSMSGIWLTQTINNPKWFKKAIEQKLKDLWINIWHRNLATKNICRTYKLYKEIYGTEDYLLELSHNNWISLTRLRAGNNKLPVITGRHHQKILKKRYATSVAQDR